MEQQLHCTYCQLPIKGCPPLQCIKCTEFYLCVECFSCRVEAGSHKADHGYQIDNEGSVVLFSNRTAWNAPEEESFLDAVEQYSVGNWEDISDSVKTRTAEECQEHFSAYFINGNIGKATLPCESVLKKVADHTAAEKEVSATAMVPVDLTILEQQELGYMPLRDDFENEYDDDAESLISSISWFYDDEEFDIAFKLSQVNLYRQRLKEREHRKRIAKEFGIIQNSTSLGSKKSQIDKKKQSKDEKDLREKMQPFGRFHRPTDYEQMLHSLQREKRLKNRIKELVKYRRSGLTKVSDCSQFETARLVREKKKEMIKRMGSTGSGKPASVSYSKKERDISGKDERVLTFNHRITNGVVSLNSMPGFELLSEREKKLCNSIGLNPSTYITIKACIIKDYLQRHQGIPVKIRFPNHLDKSQRQKILTFLSDSGWISNT